MTTAPRLTRQRRAVADLLEGRRDFLSAQQIHAELRERGEGVGLATVYRNVALMVEQGELDVVLREDGESLFRRCSPLHHHHLTCRSCGRTVEVAGAPVEEWAAAMAADHGFAEVEHTVELLGLCPSCAKGAADAG